ncbi:MAG: SufD family Fe-S cluster assembly protein [Candidatus Omnitrophica bacterium]|nr:SufD family Fe-S cluster assembly protein [Candidatus Omnitrophota bacterium]MDD5654520.1 SufD family Fe-S cluster assembly protein [Candidatus Omnitrophota bacterium]
MQKIKEDLDRKAQSAYDKKASFGDDIDLESYRKTPEEAEYPKSLADLTSSQVETVLSAGIDVKEKERWGTFLQMDHSVIHARSKKEGLEVMSASEALKKYDWLWEYYWKAVAVDSDKYTAHAQLNPYHGYFIRALPGVKASFPIQACLFLKSGNLIQSVHNIIIAEEGSDLQIITGCATESFGSRGVHIGISEFFVKKNAKVTFTMVHNWHEDIVVRPRTGTIVEENGIFLSNYICLKRVKDIQMYPKAVLAGKNSLARYNSILYAHPGSRLDIGSRVNLLAENSRAEIIARAIAHNGTIIARGNLRGETAPIKAHLECRGLILGDQGNIYAIPELEGCCEGVDMSHEAAVGKIAKEEIEYLMARGLSAQEAQAAIVRGFLDVSIMGLPDVLKGQINKAIESCEKEAL